MRKKNPDNEWLQQVPEHLRPHVTPARKVAGRQRKAIDGLRPRHARSPSEARMFAAAVEKRIELMRQEKEWDTNALAHLPVQVEMVIEDEMGGEPEAVEWQDEEPERYVVVDEGEDAPEDPDQQRLLLSHEARIDQVDVEEACQVMLDARSYHEAAERLKLTIGELKALRQRAPFNKVYTQRYAAAKASDPREYAIQPYRYWEGHKERGAREAGTGPLQLRMDEIILTLIQYPTVAEAAKKLKIKPSTLDILRRDPRFQVRFHERRQEALALGTLILQMNYSKINQELLAMAYDADVPAVVRANIALQLSKRVEEQIEREQNSERMIRQLEQYKVLLDKASKVTVDEVIVEGEERGSDV